MNYWMERLCPLINKIKKGYDKDWLFLCSDRVGKENDTKYNGCSCLVKL